MKRNRYLLIPSVGLAVSFACSSNSCKPTPPPTQIDGGTAAQPVIPAALACKGNACRPDSFGKNGSGPEKKHEDEQGPYLEGAGLERYHFPGDGGVTLDGEVVGVDACPKEHTANLNAKVTGCVDHSSYADCRIFVLGGGSGESPCYAPRDAGAAVVLVKGYWDGQALFQDDNNITVACAELDGGSAIASCIHKFGYLPDSRERFLTCIRMMRADYCGDGCPFTKAGTCIDAYDDGGVHGADCDGGKCGGGLCHEADWGLEGAVSISHLRWEDSLQHEGNFPTLCKGRFHQKGSKASPYDRNDAGRPYLSNRSQHHLKDGGIEVVPFKTAS